VGLKRQIGLLFQNRCHLFPEILDYVRPADPPLLAFGGVIDMDHRDFFGQELHWRSPTPVKRATSACE